MEKSELLNWLDEVIDSENKLYKLGTLCDENNNEVCRRCYTMEASVHIYRGIEKLADACGKKLKTTLHDTIDDRPTYVAYFTYKDKRIFELFDEGEALR